MKKYFFLLICLYTSFAFSQESNDKKVFMDSLSNETKDNNYHHYCIIKDYYLDLNEYKVTGYYKSGKLRMEGFFKNKDLKNPTGQAIYYYENGNKDVIENYDADSRLDGEIISWYENGNKKLQQTYLHSELAGQEISWYENGNKKSEITSTGEKWGTKRYKIDQFWDKENKQTVINGNGFCNLEDKFELSFGNIKDGFKDGVWTGNYLKNKGFYSETYKDGQFISGVFTDTNKNTHEYTALEIQPQPKKGLDDFRNYLGENIKIPRKAKIMTGKIIIEFTVEKDGKISEAKIVKSVDSELDAEAIKILKRYEKWIPGQQRGQNIRVRYSIPLMFRLPN